MLMRGWKMFSTQLSATLVRGEPTTIESLTKAGEKNFCGGCVRVFRNYFDADQIC